MKTWLRRLTYLLIVLIWFTIMTFPIAAFVLADRGEIQFGDDLTNNTRIFLIQEPDSEGIGIQRINSHSQGECTETAVSFWMWEGEGENSIFCSCSSGEGYPDSCR